MQKRCAHSIGKLTFTVWDGAPNTIPYDHILANDFIRQSSLNYQGKCSLFSTTCFKEQLE